MSFNNDFARKYLGASEVDAIRSLRPGGPFDRLVLNLKCKRCHEKKKEPMRWFHLNDFICPCGGTFDDKPLRDALAKGTIEYLLKTRSPDEILEIFDERDGQA